MDMPFGQYKGTPLQDIPTHYLSNVMNNVKTGILWLAIHDELLRRRFPSAVKRQKKANRRHGR